MFCFLRHKKYFTATGYHCTCRIKTAYTTCVWLYHPYISVCITFHVPNMCAPSKCYNSRRRHNARVAIEKVNTPYIRAWKVIHTDMYG